MIPKVSTSPEHPDPHPISSSPSGCYGDEEKQAISSFSFLENISPTSPSNSSNNKFSCEFPSVEPATTTAENEAPSPVKEIDQSTTSKVQESFNPGFESSSSHGNESDHHGDDLDLKDQSPFDVIQSYCEIEKEWDQDGGGVEKNQQENEVEENALESFYAKLTQSQYSDEELIVYHDDTLLPQPTTTMSDDFFATAKCNLDFMCDSLTDSAISQGGGRYLIPRPEHPTVRYLKEESRLESIGRLSSSEEKFNFDEDFVELSDIGGEKFSSNSSNEELFI